jgi:hypothetical protein
MRRSEFNKKFSFRLVGKGSAERCGNCRHYLPGVRTLAVGCGLMLGYMMSHGEIRVSRSRGVCDCFGLPSEVGFVDGRG